MNLRTALEQLPEAELEFAYFNALRTTPASTTAGISRGNTTAFTYLIDTGRPESTYYNRAATLSTTSLSDSTLAELPQHVGAIETKPADLTPESAFLLHKLGFIPQYQLCYLACKPSYGQPATYEVERLHSTQVDVFFDLLERQGVSFSPDKRAAKRQYYCTEQFQAYIARSADGTIAGWTTTFMGNNYAFFGNAYTLPEYRRSGVHSALLVARLTAAAEFGVQIAYTDVEHQSQSHYNCERAGFRTLSINTIWGKASKGVQ
jgi:GNAT superfamily N-acetyltransferase